MMICSRQAKVRLALTCALLAGCFGAHRSDDDPERDAGVGRDARLADARPPRRDARMVADAGGDLGFGACTCVEDSVCGAPPPFGCGQGVCVFEALCTVGVHDEGCGPDARCDPATLECATEPSMIDVATVTNFSPVAEFDGVAVSVEGAIVARHVVSADEPYLDGVLVASFGTAATDIVVEVTLYDGCEVVQSRRVNLASLEDGSRITVVFTRR